MAEHRSKGRFHIPTWRCPCGTVNVIARGKAGKCKNKSCQKPLGG